MYVSISLVLHSFKTDNFYIRKYLVKPNFARLLLHELRPDIVMDVRYSFNPDVDKGAFIQVECLLQPNDVS